VYDFGNDQVVGSRALTLMDSHPKLAPLGSASSSRELNEIASLTTITEAELRQATVLTAVRRRIPKQA
jgi:hypothetical protein